MIRLSVRCLCLVWLFSFCVSLSAADFSVLPQRIELIGRESQQRVSAIALRDQTPSAVLDAETITWTVEDPSIAVVEANTVRPLADGETTLLVKRNEHLVRVPVKVSGIGDAHAWSFRNDVQSVLAKRGCNQGACHGALAGKGGFRLSLRGYDSESDFLSITRQARGRRIELGDPGRSLLIAKPTGAFPHKGGLKLSTDSRDYRILAEWIASGAAAPEPSDAKLETIEVLPETAIDRKSVV